MTERHGRHPWQCQHKFPGGRRCGFENRAKHASCQACGAEYHQERREYEVPCPPSIMRRPTVRESVEEYQDIAKLIRHHFQALDALEVRLGVAFGFDTSFSDRMRLGGFRNRERMEFDNADPIIKDVEREVWSRLVGLMEIQRFSSVQRWREISKQLDEGELPELTVETVGSWLETLRGQLDDMVEEKLREVFEFLRPPRSKYKTNTEGAIGKRVIIHMGVEPADARWAWKPSIQCSRFSMLMSLESLFRTLDGKGHMTAGHYPAIVEAMRKAQPDNPVVEDEYVRAKAHRNGNLHLEFLRPDLVAEINRRAGKLVLERE